MNRDLKKLVEKLDKVFSLFIRLRDADKSGNVRCCTCSLIKPWKQVDCGHFITRGAFATRWEEKNTAGQCKGCNGFRGGEQHLFAQYIDKRWGEGTSEMLQIKRHNTFHLDRTILIYLIGDYETKVSKLKKEKGL